MRCCGARVRWRVYQKLLPLARLLISIPAGMISMNFTKYTISSLMGVALWNLIFIGAGYFLGDSVWSLLA